MRHVKYFIAESLIDRWEKGYLSDQDFLKCITDVVTSNHNQN